MTEKPIINHNRKNQLQKLLLTDSKEDETLAVSIVDNCNIEKSFPMLLQLMAACPDQKYTMHTALINSKNFLAYTYTLIRNDVGLIPAQHSLDFILDLWERHNKIQIIKEDMVQRKKLILAYQGNELIASFNPTLNPKKNVKRK
jgi:hypothetical protein